MTAKVIRFPAKTPVQDENVLRSALTYHREQQVELSRALAKLLNSIGNLNTAQRTVIDRFITDPDQRQNLKKMLLPEQSGR